MKKLTYLFCLSLLFLGLNLVSCNKQSAQELHFSLEEITQSESFQAYAAHKAEIMTLLEKYAKIKVDENASPEVQLAQLETQRELSEMKILLFEKVKIFFEREAPDFDTAKNDADTERLLRKLLDFIHGQEMDQGVKDNVAAYYKLIFENKEAELARQVMNDFPQIKDKSELTELYIEYKQ